MSDLLTNVVSTSQDTYFDLSNIFVQLTQRFGLPVEKIFDNSNSYEKIMFMKEISSWGVLCVTLFFKMLTQILRGMIK